MPADLCDRCGRSPELVYEVVALKAGTKPGNGVDLCEDCLNWANEHRAQERASA